MAVCILRVPTGVHFMVGPGVSMNKTPVAPLLLITGPVGAGKTSVGGEVSTQLSALREPHAFVDVDALSWAYPSPSDDPYRVRLMLANLAAIWPNFQAAGARRLVLAGVIEHRHELEGYTQAIPGALITVVRLCAPVPTLQQRLRGRERGGDLEWHLQRAPELAAIMDRAALEDVLIETEGKSVPAIATEVLQRTGWLVPSSQH
jgi:hypothetical protein